MGPETVVPTMFFLLVFGAPIAAFIVSRVLGHQERMEMIRRGIVPPPDPHAMRRAMKYQAKMGGFPPGPMQAGCGMPAGYDPDYYAQHQLRRGIQVAFIGLALLIGLSFIGWNGGQIVFGPWLLGGLIPMFVGVAQIISAVLSGARVGGPVGVGQTTFGPADPGEAQPTAGATTSPGTMPPPPGPYGGWRPGPTPEIGKPPPPPDYRG